MQMIKWIGAVMLAAAPAGAVPVTLEWNPVTQNADATPISDLGGYWLYYSTTSFNRSGWLTPAQARAAGDVQRIAVNAAQTSRTVDLSGGSTYYFRLTAYDASLNESAFNLSAGGAQEQVSAFLAGPSILSFGRTPPGLKDAYGFPNPARPGQDPVVRAMMGDVDDCEITIFDASGRAVHTARVTGTTVVGGQTAFDYRWTGEKAAGVYYAVIHGRRGTETIRARASFAVIR